MRDVASPGLRLCPPDHRHPHALPRSAGQSLGRPLPGHEADRWRRLVPLPAATFPAPPFPEYSSGHSSFSAAGAEILRLFTHNDRFGGSVTLPAGSSRIEPAAVPASDLTLSWATFSEPANQAGISRRYGGIHFEQRDLDAALKAATGLQQLLAQPHAAAEGVQRANGIPHRPAVTPGETAPG